MYHIQAPHRHLVGRGLPASQAKAIKAGQPTNLFNRDMAKRLLLVGNEDVVVTGEDSSEAQSAPAKNPRTRAYKSRYLSGQCRIGLRRSITS